MNLDVFAFSDFDKLLLSFQRLVHLVIRHTENPQLSLPGVLPPAPRKHYEISDEWCDYGFGENITTMSDGFFVMGAVDEPKSTQYIIHTSTLYMHIYFIYSL